MSALGAACDALNERTNAVAGEQALGDERGYSAVSGDPREFCRAFLSGYVPMEEMDDALELLAQAAGTMRESWNLTPSAASRDASALTTMAQMVLLGVVIGRETRDE